MRVARTTAVLVGMLAGLHSGLARGQTVEEVIPDFYKEAGIQTNRTYVNQNFNEHVDPFTGGLQHHYVDVHVPGNGGFDLNVVRSYNNASVVELNPAAYEGQAGLGWTIHFGRVLHKNNTLPCSQSTFGPDVSKNPVVELPDGGRKLLAFTGNVSPMMMTTDRWKADCAPNGMGLIVYSPEGVRYDMTQQVGLVAGRTAWYTTKITDRNGNYATISYTAASPQITGITTNDGRSVSFTYYDSGALTRRIRSISTSGYTYNYDYQAVSGVTGTYNLMSVTRPGGTQWKYGYNGALGSTAGSHMMNRVTYPEGGSIDYGYGYVYFDGASNPDSRSTVVKTKNSSNGGNWSFNYAPGSSSTYDTTTVSTPSGTLTYKHIGPNYAASGSVWKVGLLMSKTVGSTQTETYDWAKQSISNQSNRRPGVWTTRAIDTNEVNAALMSTRTISRDGATHSTTYSNFDAYGNPRTMTESGPNGGSRSTTLTYYTNTAKWIVRQAKDQTVSGGVSITRTFDTSGNLSSVDRDGVSTGYSYDGQGNVSRAEFPRSLVHTYSNYKRGIAQTENQPEGVSLSRSVSDAGNVTSFTNGVTTGYTYDDLNRVKTINPPTGSGVSIDYFTSSKRATRGSLTESTDYNGFGKATSVTTGGIQRTYGYDALGRMTFASNPGSSSGTTYQYDILDRVRRITNADSTYQTITYGSGSKTVTNERSKATTYTYRAYGDPDQQLLMNVASPEPSASISIGRNGKGLVSSVTQNGVTRTYGYNGNGYLDQVINPETGTTTYGRDAAGNMRTRSVGSSGAATFGYDGQNRQETASYPGSTPSVTKTYTRTNKLKTVTSSVASHVYGYDGNDNLKSDTLSVDGNTFTTSYNYTGLDQLSSITYPRSGRTVSYSPNSLGRPTQVSGFVSSVSYFPSGQVNQISYANGTTSSYGQHASRLWPSKFTAQKGGTSYVDSTYGYDDVGNVKSISDPVDSSFNRTMGYDDIDRVTSVGGPWGSGSISYSGSGNITSQSLGASSLSYSYDSNNRLSSISGSRSTSYTYDNYGDIASAYGNTYSYDGAPNLTCINCADPVNKVVYQYDGLNQRVSVTKAGVKTYEVYGANGRLLLEYAGAPAPQLVEYIYLGNSRVAQVQSKPTSTTLAVSPSAPAVNQVTTLTATVSGSSPTGTVTFFDGATSLGEVALVSGVATRTVPFATPGARTLTAQYVGDANNDPSTSAATSLMVGGSVTALSSSAQSVNLEQAFTLSATVAPSNATGTVAFWDTSKLLGTVPVSAGRATLTTKLIVPGTHSGVHAIYSGDAANVSSTSPNIVIVASSIYATSAAGFATPNPVKTAQNVTFTVTVTGGAPTGTVSFSDGATVLGSANVVGGVATFTKSFTTFGAKTITATYGGDSGHVTSSTIIPLQVLVPVELYMPVILDLLLND